MSGHFHGHAFRYTRTHAIPDGRTAKIVWNRFRLNPLNDALALLWAFLVPDDLTLAVLFVVNRDFRAWSSPH